MGNTLSGFTVKFGTSGFVEEYNVFGHPTAILGKTPTGQPFPINCDANGNIIITGSGGGGGIPITQPTVTPNFFAPASTTPVVIPVGAIDASVLILTGTGTLNGVDQPLGVPWTEPNKLAATVTLVLGSPGTARVYYGT